MNKDYLNFSYYNFESGKITTISKYNTFSKMLRDGANSVLKKCDIETRMKKIESIVNE